MAPLQNYAGDNRRIVAGGSHFLATAHVTTGDDSRLLVALPLQLARELQNWCKELATYEPDYSAPRVGRYRAHNNGDHSQCLYENCGDRQELEKANEDHLFAIAVFDELYKHRISAEEFFGELHDAAVTLAYADPPDWLPAQPDNVHYLAAAAAVSAFQDK